MFVLPADWIEKTILFIMNNGIQLTSENLKILFQKLEIRADPELIIKALKDRYKVIKITKDFLKFLVEQKIFVDEDFQKFLTLYKKKDDKVNLEKLHSHLNKLFNTDKEVFENFIKKNDLYDIQKLGNYIKDA